MRNLQSSLRFGAIRLEVVVRHSALSAENPITVMAPPVNKLGRSKPTGSTGLQMAARGTLSSSDKKLHRVMLQPSKKRQYALQTYSRTRNGSELR